MDFFTIPIKKYKQVFWTTVAVNVAAVITTYILFQKGTYLLRGFDPGSKLTLPFLGLVVILAVIHSNYQRKRLQQLVTIEDFETRVAAYEKFYTLRMWWFVFSCASSCLLTLFTNRPLFIYYGAFDILMSLPFFPARKRFRRELQNEEILLY
ncbi:hypothetical protein [Ferruginibacter sp. HRS2-29]|uniref:hypothetical protein n=1 Tax=Ferruginibacter sp. HRS2-29 TaxID=2487334 RepID=UPI0020CEFC2C|nr:hypothetical protein [Ferruginibacter sp. HRS2-29]MCP9752895.1 hypothetical protein [Ferruginibacter sp. HRS2-29]